MRHGHCFISYASERRDLADAVCRRLEERSFKCWIAPRDVGPGNYGGAIVQAIKSADALVLIRTREAIASGFVRRELEVAAAADVAIVPLRFDDSEAPPDTAFFLAGMHEFDLRQGTLDTSVAALANHLQGLPPRRSVSESKPQQAPQPRRFASPMQGFLDWVMGWFMGLSPPLVAFGVVAAALVIVGVSLLVGVGSFAYRLPAALGGGAKQVGFLWAVNWSLGFLLIYPVLAAVAIQAVREMRDIAASLSKRRMVVDEAFRLAEPGRVQYELQRRLRVATAVAIGLLVFGVAYSLWEFFTVVGVHYFADGGFPESIAMDDPFQERDWSVAALLQPANGTPVPKWPNFAFALVAYLLMVGVGTALVLSVFVLLLTVTTFTYGLSGREGLRFIPDLRSRGPVDSFDPRCGFQLFEGTFRKGLLVVLLAFVGLFLAHLQNLYMRSPAESLLRFVAPAAADGDLLASFKAFFGTLVTEEGVANLNSAIAFGLASCLFSSVVLLLSLSLRQGARRAREFLLERISDEEEPLPDWLADLGRQQAQERLAEMRFWPVRWPRVNQILLAMAVAFVSMLFYRVGVLLIAGGLGFALWRAFEPEPKLAKAR